MTRRLLPLLLIVAPICIAHLRTISAHAGAPPETPQEQCKKLPDLAGLADKSSNPLKNLEDKNKSPLTTLPAETVVEVEFADVAPVGSEYCASLGGRPVTRERKGISPILEIGVLLPPGVREIVEVKFQTQGVVKLQSTIVNL